MAEASRDPNMETLVEIFRCFICTEKLRDARMCPHCSKMCCSSCINRWLTDTRAQCPHCRAPLLIDDVINCRWAEEVTEQLDILQQFQESRQGRLFNMSESIERCTIHSKEEMSVFCITCESSICHECALWGTSHENHSFKPLDEIYNQHVDQVKEETGKLRKRSLEVMGSIQDVEKSIECVRTAKDQTAREIRNAVELMIARLDAQLKSKLLRLVKQKGLLNRKLEDIETVLVDTEKQVKSGPKNEVIRQSPNILSNLKDQITKSNNLTITSVPTEFQSELVPSYCGTSFYVENFSAMKRRGGSLYSKPLFLDGLTWRLKVYPNGNGVVRGTYLSVFLELTNGPLAIAKYEYRIEMICLTSNDPSKNTFREFASDFENGECWGYNRFCRLDALEPDGFYHPEWDAIRLSFQVRAPTFYQKCKDQSWYISQLHDSEHEQRQELEVLQRRIMMYENINKWKGKGQNFSASAVQEAQATPNDGEMEPQAECSSSLLSVEASNNANSLRHSEDGSEDSEGEYRVALEETRENDVDERVLGNSNGDSPSTSVISRDSVTSMSVPAEEHHFGVAVRRELDNSSCDDSIGGADPNRLNSISLSMPRPSPTDRRLPDGRLSCLHSESTILKKSLLLQRYKRYLDENSL